MFKSNKAKNFLIIFLMLSIMKFFTAKVGLSASPTTLLVIRPNISVTNSFIIKGEGPQFNKGKYTETWYYEGRYKVITGDEIGFSGESIYDLLILLWWFFAAGLLFYALSFKIQSRAKKIG